MSPYLLNVKALLITSIKTAEFTHLILCLDCWSLCWIVGDFRPLICPLSVPYLYHIYKIIQGLDVLAATSEQKYILIFEMIPETVVVGLGVRICCDVRNVYCNNVFSKHYWISTVVGWRRITMWMVNYFKFSAKNCWFQS